MPLSKEEIQVLLTARSNLSPVLGRALTSLKRLKTNIGGITKGLGQMTAAVGGINALSLTALSAAGIKVGSDFNASAALLEESGESIQKTFLDIKAFNPQVEIDNLSEGLRTMTERFSEAKQGTGDAADALKRIGADLSIDGVLNQLEEIRTKFKDIKTVSERIELTNILFGDEDARQVLSYLKATEGQIDRVRKAREKLGLVVSNESLRNIKEARASMGTLQSVFTQFAVSVAGKVTPLITEAAAKFLAFVEANGGIVDFVDRTFELIKAKSAVFLSSVSGVANTIRRIYAKLSGDLSALTLDELKSKRTDIEKDLTGMFKNFGLEKNQQALADVNQRIAEIEKSQNSLIGSTDDGTASWVEYFKAQSAASLSAMELNGALSGTSGAVTGQAASVDKTVGIIETAMKRINGLKVNGLGDLDLSGTQLARRGLADMETEELAHVLGLNIPDDKKQMLAQSVREQIGQMDLNLNLQANLAIDEVRANEQITNLMDQYNAQIGRDDAVQIPVALGMLDEQNKSNAAADKLKQTDLAAKGLQSTINAVTQGFDMMASVSQSSGNSAFESFKKTSAAISAVAAVTAAIKAASVASAAGPVAALGAYATVAGSLFSAVAAIGGISPGNTPSSAPGTGGASSGGAAPATGPLGGAAETSEEVAGDTFNITLAGADSDTVTLGSVRNLLNVFRRNESERRAFQNILVS